MVRPGLVRQGMVWQARLGLVRFGEVRLGGVRLGNHEEDVGRRWFLLAPSVYLRGSYGLQPLQRASGEAARP